MRYLNQVSTINQWRHLLENTPQSATVSDDNALTTFCSLASVMVNSENMDIIQQFLLDFPSSPSLAWIANLTDDFIPDAVQYELPKMFELWSTVVRPFFDVLVNQNVTGTMLFKEEVKTVLHFIIGSEGTRFQSVYGFVLKLLQNMMKATSGSYEDEITSTVALVSILFQRLVIANRSALATAKFQAVGNSLKDICNELPSKDYYTLKSSTAINGALLYLRNLKKSSIPEPINQKVKAKLDSSCDIDFPGDLSCRGPRHSNDHERIMDINVLPLLDEVLANRTDYLPAVNPDLWHLPGLAGLLDRHFRLIREDSLGTLKNIIRHEYQHLTGHPQDPQDPLYRQNETSVHFYRPVFLSEPSFEERAGLTFLVHCKSPTHPPEIQSRQEWQKWWASTKRLEKSALLCLLSVRSLIFCRVSKSPETSLGDEFVKVRLRLAEPRKDEMLKVTQLIYSAAAPQLVMIEFSNILFESFSPVLEALKQYSKNMDLAFASVFAPEPEQETSVSPDYPMYARRPGFTFDLSTICTDVSEPLKLSPEQHVTAADICERTSLDRSQADAFLNSLQHSVAIIQGPPGTGKSYTGVSVIKALLGNKTEADLGPLICVCYTNHALDQLLERLLKDESKMIIRLGSRSKSAAVRKLNLYANIKGARWSDYETQVDKNHSPDQGLQIQNFNTILTQLKEINDPGKHLLEYLEKHVPQFYNYIQGLATEAEQRSEQVKIDTELASINKWLAGGQEDHDSEIDTDDIQALLPELLNHKQRNLLYSQWVANVREAKLKELSVCFDSAVYHGDRVKQARDELSIRCLRQADVIGLTTTGMAMNINLFRALGSKVIIFEEAGQVLEGHILPAMLPSIEHAILIGDHKQLRPQIQDWKLQTSNPRGKKHSLDVSLFERLIQPRSKLVSGLPYSTLEVQRRMHPSISQLIHQIYPKLTDFPEVARYPPVRGVKKRLFWLHHQCSEDLRNDEIANTSYSTGFEVAMTVCLVSHIIRQGDYDDEDVTVLTPYKSQLQKIYEQLSTVAEIWAEDPDASRSPCHYRGNASTPVPQDLKHKRKVRLSTVDGFQGEESKIVVISLVRSNNDRKCGFLATPNRINVLLSRAKHGMYLIGNAETYKSINMWSTVLDIMKRGGNFGSAIELKCPRHPHTPISVSEPHHFISLSPEGGCNLNCDQLLPCGHSCEKKCHSTMLHKAVVCVKNCSKLVKGCEHLCPRPCNEQCVTRCSIILSGHEITLPCGHELQNPCCADAQNPESVCCTVLVKEVVPGSEQIVEMLCSDKTAQYRLHVKI